MKAPGRPATNALRACAPWSVLATCLPLAAHLRAATHHPAGGSLPQLRALWGRLGLGTVAGWLVHGLVEDWDWGGGSCLTSLSNGLSLTHPMPENTGGMATNHSPTLTQA